LAFPTFRLTNVEDICLNFVYCRCCR